MFFLMKWNFIIREFYGNLSTFYFSVLVVFFAICEMLSVLIQELSIESYILQWPATKCIIWTLGSHLQFTNVIVLKKQISTIKMKFVKNLCFLRTNISFFPTISTAITFNQFLVNVMHFFTNVWQPINIRVHFVFILNTLAIVLSFQI